MSFNKWFKKLKKEYDKRAVAITLSTETYIQELKEAYEAGQQDGESMHELQTENFRLSGEIKALGERCNQLLKDKGKLIDENRELIIQIDRMKCDVTSERDESVRVEDIITTTVLNNILKKWELAND